MRIFKKVFLILLSIFVFSGCISKNDTTRIDNPSAVKKKQSDCKKDIKIMNYAFTYVLNEFEKGYFQEQDILGAKAQLFLINNKSKSVFAQNIIAAEKSYNTQYKKLKKKNCNINKFSVSPLQKIKNKIKKMDANNETVIGK